MTALLAVAEGTEVEAGGALEGPHDVRERLEAFGAEVLTAAMNRPAQMRNGDRYLRGLIEQGQRKSLEPMLGRLGEEASYESMQNFLADSPWDPTLVVRTVAERVGAEIDVEAWVLDDTGFPKDGKRSPGVKRQYSGTLGKIGNCQIGVSLHAVGAKGTVPAGWALYLPKEWAEDAKRRVKAKIPPEVEFQTKPELGAKLVERAREWDLTAAPVLGDAAYGDNTAMRERLHEGGSEYVLSVSAETTVFAPETSFVVPQRSAGGGRPPSRPRPDQKPEAIGDLVARLGREAFETVSFRDGPDGPDGPREPISSRFAFIRVRAAHEWRKASEAPREEWLICEWPEGAEAPIDYWISNMPADTARERLARLARLRWKIELDYKQLKGELGLDHYEGRSWLGWYHHTALVSAAHGFLTLERMRPKARRPV